MKASLMLASTCLLALLGWSWGDEWLLYGTRAGSGSGSAWYTAEAQPAHQAWSVSALGCLLGMDEPQCPAQSVACSPRCRMRRHPPSGLQHVLHPHLQLLPPPCCCGSTSMYAQYLLSCLLWVGKGEEGKRGLLHKAASWIFSHYMKISRVCK